MSPVGLPDAPEREEDRRVRARRDSCVKTALWLLVLLNLAAIFYFSAQPDPESSRQSRRVAEAAVREMPVLVMFAVVFLVILKPF